MTSQTLELSPAVLALRRSPIPVLRKLSLEETEEAVVLSGNVASYYLKQLAQETIMPALAGRTLQNRVLVVRHAT